MLFIKTYSGVFDLIICFVTVLMIGACTYLVADMDAPYVSRIQPTAIAFLSLQLQSLAAVQSVTMAAPNKGKKGNHSGSWRNDGRETKELKDPGGHDLWKDEARAVEKISHVDHL